MLTTILYMLLLQLIVVIIIDCSDFPSTIKKALSYILTKGKIKTDNYMFHLVDCSFCICWWTNFVFILCIGQFSIPYIALALFLAYMVTPVREFLILIYDVCIKIITKINDSIK